MDWMPQAIREGIFTILFISGPLVVLAAALGLAVGILQAATQVQEQTLGSAVKVIGLFIALIIFGFYMFQYMSKYTTDSINKAFKLVPTLTAKVLPRRNFLEIPIKEPEQQISLPGEVDPGTGGGGGGVSKIAESLNEPEIETVNENVKPKTLAQPPSQVKPFPDVDKIKAQKLQPAPAKVTPAPAPVKVTPAPAKPVVVKPAPAPVKVTPAPAKPVVVQPAPVKVEPVVVPEEEPAPPPVVRIPRPVLTGRLDRLKEEAAR